MTKVLAAIRKREQAKIRPEKPKRKAKQALVEPVEGSGG